MREVGKHELLHVAWDESTSVTINIAKLTTAIARHDTRRRNVSRWCFGAITIGRRPRRRGMKNREIVGGSTGLKLSKA